MNLATLPPVPDLCSSHSGLSNFKLLVVLGVERGQVGNEWLWQG